MKNTLKIKSVILKVLQVKDHLKGSVVHSGSIPGLNAQYIYKCLVTQDLAGKFHIPHVVSTSFKEINIFNVSYWMSVASSSYKSY